MVLGSLKGFGTSRTFSVLRAIAIGRALTGRAHGRPATADFLTPREHRRSLLFG
jgi:hypothetical protein